MNSDIQATLDALDRAAQHARTYVAELDSAPVAARVSAAQLRERLGGPLPETGSAPRDVIDALVAASAGGHLGSAGGRFFAWVVGGATPAALAADWLTSVWDQNPALHSVSPSGAMAEEVAGAWLLDLLDLPRDCGFALTTGCQLAHVTCLAAARHAVLRARGWDVEERGLCGAPPLAVFVNAQHHASLVRALRLLGLGRASLRELPTRDDGTVDPARFAQALAGHAGPCIVGLNAGDLNIGAFDPFAQLVPLARRAGAWVHVDGAFGLISRASPTLRALSRGVEDCDSWATDAHKWLNVPYDCGVAIVRDRSAQRAAMTVSASYLASVEGVREPMDWNPEWSHRARGFALWACLRELGRAGAAALVERCCAHARALVAGIGSLEGAQVLWMPTLNQGLVRFLDPRGADHDRRTDEVIAAINASGEAFFSGTTWRGLRAMRVSVCNWRTSPADVARAVAAARDVLRAP
jgi:glutamate/tyrosine decarboxylase-like PLP-dependent enzyme